METIITYKKVIHTKDWATCMQCIEQELRSLSQSQTGQIMWSFRHSENIPGKQSDLIPTMACIETGNRIKVVAYVND